MSSLYKRLRMNTTSFVNSKQWEPATVKENYQYQPSLQKEYNVAIDQLINMYLKKVDFKSRHSGNGDGSGGGSSVKSDMTCHKCGKKGYMKKDCRSKVTVSSAIVCNKS